MTRQMYVNISYSPLLLSMPIDDRDKGLCELVRLLKQGKVTTVYATNSNDTTKLHKVVAQIKLTKVGCGPLATSLTIDVDCRLLGLAESQQKHPVTAEMPSKQYR